LPSKNELRKKIRKARLEAVDSIIWNLPAGKRLVKNSGLMSEMLLIFCISEHLENQKIFDDYQKHKVSEAFKNLKIQKDF